MSVAPALADDLAARLRADGYAAAVIGSVREGAGLTVEALGLP
jgi:hypothetical protein